MLLALLSTEMSQNLMVENTPTLGGRTEIVNLDLCTTEGIMDLQMLTQENTWNELMCHIITNSLSLNNSPAWKYSLLSWNLLDMWC